MSRTPMPKSQAESVMHAKAMNVSAMGDGTFSMFLSASCDPDVRDSLVRRDGSFYSWSTMNRARVLVMLIGVTLASAVGSGQGRAGGPIKSPEIGADRRVTFRLRAPNAREVIV